MSGIAMIVRVDGAPASRSEIEAMTAAMAFRALDGVGYLGSGAAALGHCALHASNEERNTQPISGGDSGVAISFDGYLANREALLRDLPAAANASEDDALLALRAYEKWGENFAPRLEGEFAALVWDRRKGHAFCLADHHGLRPLYWHWDGKRLVAASDIAAILAVLPANPPFNLDYLAEIACDVAYVDDETIWQGIRRVPPAHLLRLDTGTAGVAPEAREYWQLPTEVDIRYRHESAYFEHYREVLAECVRASARSHRPVGCEVSGGLDSTGIFCMAHRLAAEGRLPAPGLRGYTLAGPEGSEADERRYAQAAAAHTGVTVEEQPLFSPPLDWFARRASEDGDLPPYPNAAMSIGLERAAAQEGCRVLMTGIGGDQWLDGTNLYYSELVRSWRADRLLTAYAADIEGYGFARASAMLLRLGPGSLVPVGVRHAIRDLLARSPGDTGREHAFVRPEFRHRLAERKAQYEARFPRDYRYSYKLRKLKFPRWTRILDQAGRQRARSGLEMRSPMMSRAFIEFSARIPEHLRLRGGKPKYLHRRALAGILPPEIASRNSKAEFSTVYFAQDQQVYEYCSSAWEKDDLPLLRAEEIRRSFEDYRAATIDERCTGRIWGLYESILMLRQGQRTEDRERT